MSTVYVVVCMDTEGPCADPANPGLLATWDEVDAAADRLFDPSFRRRFPDPGGGSLRPNKIGYLRSSPPVLTADPSLRSG